MKVKHQLYNQPAGFCNHLYFVLQSYVQSTPECKVVQCICEQDLIRGIYDKLCMLNLNSLIEPGVHPQYVRIPSNAQLLNEDFTLSQLDSFIRQYILKSKLFTEYKITEEKERCLGIHIRNGDFLWPIWKFINCFDRKDYLIKAINQQAFQKFDQVHVFSDDLGLCTQQYHSILAAKFKTIKYITCGVDMNDFVELSHYKNKIIWNSTFSYWSSFISDVIYNYTGSTACPGLSLENEPSTTRCPPHWLHIPVIPQ